MGVIARSILIGGFVAGLMTTALLGVTAYVFLSVGALAVESAQNATRDRGTEIGHALARMAGEKFDGDMAVKLSAVMAQVVRLSEQAATDFTIQEIMLLDASGELMAHNDVALLAVESEERKTYAGEDYAAALRAPFREPARLKSIESAATPAIPLYSMLDTLFPEAGEAASRRFPEKVSTRTHISVAVFPVDQELASGAIHIFVKHDATNRVVAALRSYSVETLSMIAGFVFLIAAILILIMSLSFRDGGAPRQPAARPARRRKATARTVLDDPAKDERETEGAAAGIIGPARESVLAGGPGPANRLRRRPALPDPVVAGEPVLQDSAAQPKPTATATPVTGAAAPAADQSFASADGAGYDDDDVDEFIDDYAAGSDENRGVYDLDVHRAARIEQAPAATDAGGTPGYRPGPRIMDAIPLENFSQNKTAGGGGNARS